MTLNIRVWTLFVHDGTVHMCHRVETGAIAAVNRHET